MDDLEGNGTEKNPYKIRCTSDLIAIQTETDAVFELVSDIDCTELEEPIKDKFVFYEQTDVTLDCNFSGQLNGNSHTISGLSQPLFSEILPRGMVWDVCFSNCTIESPSLAGVIAGENKGTITNCTVTDSTVVSTDSSAGGISGCTRDGGIVQDSEVKNTKVNSYHGAGGISAYINGIVESSIVTSSTVNAKSYAGGISGYIEKTTAKNCTCENTRVISDEDYSGGGFGEIQSASVQSIYVDKCIVENHSGVSSGFADLVWNAELSNITVDSLTADCGFIRESVRSEWGQISIVNVKQPLFEIVFPIVDLVQYVSVSNSQKKVPEKLLARFTSEDCTVSLYSNNIVVQESPNKDTAVFEMSKSTKELLLDSDTLSDADYISDSLLREKTIRGL